MLMTRHFDYGPNAGEGDNQSVRSSAPVVSRGRLAWWLLGFFLHVSNNCKRHPEALFYGGLETDAVILVFLFNF